VSSTQKRH